MNKIEITIDVITGKVTEVVTPFTAEELATNVAIDAEQQAIIQAQVTAKQSAMAKLAKLGLTEDEVKALIGQ